MAATVDITHNHLYAEIRAFLLDLFQLDEEQVIRGYSNNVPFPNQPFICINIISETPMSTNWNEYSITEGTGKVTQSIEVQIQIDFYGENSGYMCRVFSNLWRDFYACEQLELCQPLYASEPQYLPFTNEISNFEERWTTTVSLNYNPTVTHDQNFITSVDIVTVRL